MRRPAQGRILDRMSAPAVTASPAAVPASMSRRRRIAVWTLVVLASVLAVVSILTTWVNRQMLDETSWRSASADLIQDPQIRSALSAYLVDQLYQNVNVANSLEQRLPPDLKPIAGPLAGALRGPATNAVNQILVRPRVQQAWIAASALAQEKLVNILENDTGAGISTGEGVVTLDVRELVRDLGIEIGLPQAALDRLPPDAGVITIMRSDQLKAAQDGVRAVKVLSVWLGIAVLVMYAVAVYLAKGARRETLRNVGWALVTVGLVVLVARRWLGTYVTDALADPAYKGSARNAYLIATEILGQIGRAGVVYGSIVVIGAVLAGPTRWATAVRRFISPVLNDRPGVAWASVAFVFLLVAAWGPTHALRAWWGILLFAALLALGVEALRRQTLREFPHVTAAPAAGGSGQPA
jgi:hypothetical protein